jgi:hypothetical protein
MPFTKKVLLLVSQVRLVLGSTSCFYVTANNNVEFDITDTRVLKISA